MMRGALMNDSYARERRCGLICVQDRPLLHRATPTQGQGAAAARDGLMCAVGESLNGVDAPLF
jgi:hypothetical protein